LKSVTVTNEFTLYSLQQLTRVFYVQDIVQSVCRYVSRPCGI